MDVVASARDAHIDALLSPVHAEIVAVDEQLRKLRATLSMARQREGGFKSLGDRGCVGSHDTQDRTRERVEMEHDLAATEGRRVEADGALASYRSETGRTLRERQSQAQLKRTESSRDVTNGSQHMVAPVTGTVRQLAVHTAGGVVTPAQVPPEGIPDHAQVTAEAELENKDVGFVRECQSAAIKLETSPFTRCGTIDATVATLSADAVVDDKRPKNEAGQTPALFLARLTLAKGETYVDGRMILLLPWMNVTAEIVTGRRRLTEYSTSPIV